MFDEQVTLAYDYFGGEKPLKWDEGVGDYVGRSEGALSPMGHEQGVTDFTNPHPVYEFQWSLGELFTALIEAGLRIDHFQEYPYSNGARWFEHTRVAPGRRMYPPKGTPRLPMMYSVTATKP
jgi:hypothetical protein